MGTHKKRFYFLCCIGLFLGVLAVLWVPVVFPYITGLSKDFTYTASVRSFDNFYDVAADDFAGAQESVTQFNYSVANINTDGTYDIENLFDVRTKAGDAIFAVTRIYGINPRTKQHVLQAGDRERSGFLFGPRMKGLFPQVTDKGSFTYWHVNYNTPAYMEFRDEENLFGTPVYRYEAVVHSDQTAELGHLPGVGVTRGVSLDTQLTLWIEPYTGYLVSYTDSTEAFFYDLATGERIHPWNSFSNQYTSASIASHAQIAANEAQKVFILSILVPAILIIVAIALFGMSFVLRRFGEADEAQQVIIQRYVVPGVVLVLFTLFSVGAWQTTVVIVANQIRSDFESQSLDVIQAIESRMDIYINALYGARGFIEASSFVSRDEWNVFINDLNLQENYPGIQGMGVVEVIAPDALEAHIERVREEGFPDYRVHPEGERDVYTSIVYLEPFDERNRQAFGFDMFHEATRRAGMVAARDRNMAVISGAVTLVQEVADDVQAGFLLYIPLYEKEAPIDTLEERRDALVGYVYSVFRFGDFMNEIYEPEAEQIHIEVFDGRGIAALRTENRMYSSHGTLADEVHSYDGFSMQETIERGEHLWTVRFTPRETFGASVIRDWLAFVVLVLGLMITAVMTLFAYTLATGRFRAAALANEMTADLREAQSAMMNVLEELKFQISDTQRFKQAVDSSTDAILMTTPDKRIVYVNGAWEALTGWSHDEAMGETPKILQSGDTPDSVYTQLSKALEAQQSFTTEDIINVRKDGSEYNAALSVYPIIDESTEETAFYVAVQQDITKRKEVDRAKTQFVSLASHQLRTPLSAIRWYAEILAESKNLTKDEQDYTAEIYHGTKRMIQLVNALLNVSRLELGTLVVVPEEVDVTQEIHATVHDIEPVAQKRSVTVRVEESPKHTMWSDTKLLRIVLDNLVTNAVKYTLEDGSVTARLLEVMPGEIYGSQSVPCAGIGITVTDTGIGIPKEQQEKIFSKLFRADNVRTIDTDGTGLGLYIVKLVAQRLGGDVWFESKEGEGTVFFVYLPDMTKEELEKDSTTA